MAKQNYSNHRKFYTLHHFVFYPAVFGLFVFCVYGFNKYPDRKFEWVALSLLTILVAWLSFMMRQHYALVPQNRIIRAEMRLRYFQLTGKRFEPVEARITFKQLAALRFASDEELPALVDRTISENLQPSEIKKLVVNWYPDHMRV
jgi:hypothetical protein